MENGTKAACLHRIQSKHHTRHPRTEVRETKRIIALLGAVMAVLWLSPAACADRVLARPGEAQHIYAEAEDYEAYRGDFYPGAMTAVSREGDDLRMEFGNSLIVLRGFFATRDERRAFTFSDGAKITAADFDDNGRFTGALTNGYSVAKRSDAAKTTGTATNTRELVTVTKRRGSTETRDADGAALYGATRANAIAAADARVALGCDWGAVESMTFTLEVDDSSEMTLVRESVTSASGVVASTNRPTTVHIADGATLVPVERGRASVRFENSQGETLQTLSVRVKDDGGAAALECLCPECGENQGGALHLLPCGHYDCAVDDAAGHVVPECGIAGHCANDDGAHGKCSNCLRPLCTGGGHGVGVCQHAHTWRQQSYTPSTATTPGQTVAVCVTCGITYTQALPLLGG